MAGAVESLWLVALSIHFTYQFHALRQEQPVAAPSLAPPSSTGRHSTAAVYFITRPQLRTFAPPRITTSRPSRVVTSRRRLSSALVCCRCATCRWLAVAARRLSVITANVVPGRQSPRDPSLPARANSACRVIHVSYRAVITDPRAESRFPARGCEHHGTAGIVSTCQLSDTESEPLHSLPQGHGSTWQGHSFITSSVNTTHHHGHVSPSGRRQFCIPPRVVARGAASDLQSSAPRRPLGASPSSAVGVGH